MNNTCQCNNDDNIDNKTVDILGYISTVIFTVLLMPQVYKTTVSKSSKDISLLFLLLGETGCSLMIPYSVILDLNPILISNIIMLSMNTYLISFKLLEKRGYIKNKEIKNTITMI
jgi:uncharacterized protein with PQ loop repeat